MTREDEKRVLLAMLLASLLGMAAYGVGLHWDWLRLPATVLALVLIIALWRWTTD